MVHTNVNDTTIKRPYESVRKNKNDQATSGHQQYSQQQRSASKNEKYGAWGSVYKSKQNFIDMHIC